MTTLKQDIKVLASLAGVKVSAGKKFGGKFSSYSRSYVDVEDAVRHDIVPLLEGKSVKDGDTYKITDIIDIRPGIAGRGARFEVIISPGKGLLMI